MRVRTPSCSFSPIFDDDLMDLVDSSGVTLLTPSILTPHYGIEFYYTKDKSIITTVGQLNFFQWAIKNLIIKYISKN